MKRTTDHVNIYPELPPEIIDIIFSYAIMMADALDMITLRLLNKNIVNDYAPFSDKERNFYVTKMLDIVPGFDDIIDELVMSKNELFVIYNNIKFTINDEISKAVKYAEKNKSNIRQIEVLNFISYFEKDIARHSSIDPLIFRKNIMRIIIIIKERLTNRGWSIEHSRMKELTLINDGYVLLYSGYLYAVRI